MEHVEIGKTGLRIPRIIFGTSCLGNLYQALPYDTKLSILKECFNQVDAPVVFDTAGKYGAGLALEIIGKGLRELKIKPEQLVLSNKLGWLRVPLRGPEPTFEPGVWADLANDAEQQISYEGILKCWEQGSSLLNPPYKAQLVSVHDPDEYLATSQSEKDRKKRWLDILDAYRALNELKKKDEIKGVGVGSKDWKIIRDLSDTVELDWVMLACSLTVFVHPPELLSFVEGLRKRGIAVINSAVFNAGFLTGGKYFDYRTPDPNSEEDKALFLWRKKFLHLCKEYAVSPSVACVQFGLSVPGILSISLNTSKPERIKENVALVQSQVPEKFWQSAKTDGLIAMDYPYLG